VGVIRSEELGGARRPHHVAPELSSARVILAVKNFAAIAGVCHIGLGVTASNTLKVLRRSGVHVEAWAVQTTKELQDRLARHAGDARPITHIIVSAPSWVQPDEFGWLCYHYPDIEFVQLNHSGTSYLSIDKFGIRNIRRCIDLELATHNLRVASNNPRVAKWLSESFGFSCLLLPNLYDCESFVNPIPVKHHASPLKVGSFGAGRPWKNQLSAAEAAVQLGRRLGVQVELWVNTKRPDGGERMIESRKELFDLLPGMKLVEVPWARWPTFRDIVATMDIMFSPSFDETFCVVVADGIAEGVPSVVTGAIEWTPPGWQCEPYDPTSIVASAVGLLHDHNQSMHDARQRLRGYVHRGLHRWHDYLVGVRAVGE
jgi:glycosyltransferase involved in cell wall biosynthesis